MSVEQPFGPTPTERWAQSGPAGYPSAADEAGADIADGADSREGRPAGAEAAASDVEGGSPAVAPDTGGRGAVVEDAGDEDAPVEERVRGQVAALDGIANVPLSEHARRYDEVHAELQAALTEIDGESS